MAVTLSSLAGAGAQFFDNNGVPLAGGLIYTYLAGTTTPAVTYTSSTGVIAHANPIVLDAAGRIATGEIWLTSGVDYKFVVKTSALVQLGSYDNIPSINDFASAYVAFANTANVALGDALVGFRQSNSAGNLTGSVGRTVHQKLQESISVKDFGAIGNGIADDTVAIRAAFEYVATTGAKCYAPAGTYLLTSLIQTLVSESFELECDPSTIFKADSTFPVDTAVFVFIAAVTGEHKFIWKNGTIDGRLMPVKVGIAAPDLMDIAGSTMRDTLIDNVSFICNDIPTDNRGDTCLGLNEGQNYTVSNCFFKGAVDAAIYITGNAAQTTGRKAVIINNTFESCNVAFISKRSFEDQIITNNFIIECNFGIVVGGEADLTLLPGKKAIISSNLLKKVNVGINARIADGTVIANNRIEDVGVDWNLTAAVGFGITVTGSKRCVVANNYVGMASFTANANTVGIFIDRFIYNGTYTSEYNQIDGNVIYNIPYGVKEDSGLANTVGGNNKYVSCTTPVTLVGPESISGLDLIGVSPNVRFQVQGAAANEGRWLIQTATNFLSITARNDDNTLGSGLLQALRTGGTITALNMSVATFSNYADDTAAAAGGVIVGGLYRTGSTLKIRVA